MEQILLNIEHEIVKCILKTTDIEILNSYEKIIDNLIMLVRGKNMK